ncbi:MAG: hypothetical protein WCK56_11690 [Alcaligenaceae bacterium]
MNPEFESLTKRRYDSEEALLAAAKRSLYYQWWRYLRLSVDYWWLCQERGKTRDKTFAKVYDDFGDLFDAQTDFDSWWQYRGTLLFAYQVSPPSVCLEEDWEALPFPLNRGYRAVRIPTNLTKTEILGQIDKLFDGYKPEPLSEKIASLRRVAPHHGIRKPVLIDTHRVWCLNDAIERGIADGSLTNSSRYTQNWIGNKLELKKVTKRKGFNFESKRAQYDNLAMRVKVNRYLRNATALIRNAEVGMFPSIQSPTNRKYWTRDQEREMKAAIADGHWRSPESADPQITSLLVAPNLLANGLANLDIQRRSRPSLRPELTKPTQ